MVVCKGTAHLKAVVWLACARALQVLFGEHVHMSGTDPEHDAYTVHACPSRVCGFRVSLVQQACAGH